MPDPHASPEFLVRCLDSVTDQQFDDVRGWVDRNLESVLEEADHSWPVRLIVAGILIEVDRAEAS